MLRISLFGFCAAATLAIGATDLMASRAALAADAANPFATRSTLPLQAPPFDRI